MSSRSSRAIRGRPTRLALDISRQNSRKPFRCQPTTVSGSTTMRALAQLRQAWRRNTQNTRSAGRSLGRECRCLKTASCWRRARFSTINSGRDRNHPRAKATVSIRARRIRLRALPAAGQWARQTPSLLGPKTHEIRHYGIASRDNRLCASRRQEARLPF